MLEARVHKHCNQQVKIRTVTDMCFTDLPLQRGVGGGEGEGEGEGRGFLETKLELSEPSDICPGTETVRGQRGK